MTDIQVIELQSVTVFWTHLGLKSNDTRYLDTGTRRILEVWWDTEVKGWLVENIQGATTPHERGVWFEDPREAMLFKLRFAGTLPRIK